MSEQGTTTSTPRWSENQQTAIGSRGKNVIVSAGAGSGKTSVLVERVIRCVVDEPALDLNRLLVVTFTEAAAAEMRKRIGDSLQDLALSAALAGRSDEYRRLSKQIGLLNQAQISTLHSFCMQVVRQNYLRLDIDPAFDILSAEDTVLLQSAVLDSVMETKLTAAREFTGDAASHPFLEMINIFGGGDPKAVFPLVFRLDTFARSQAEPGIWLEDIRTHYANAKQVPVTKLPWYTSFCNWCERNLSDALDGFVRARDLSRSIEALGAYTDNLNQAIPLMEAALSALRATEWDGLSAQLSAVKSLKSPRAKKSDGDEWVEAQTEFVKKLRTDALNALKPLSEIVGRGITALIEDITGMAPAIGELVQLVEDFEEAFLAQKRRRGQLDFNDLEHFAYQTLINPSTGEARRLQEQFAEIFVDEFQDTSPIQDALVAAIARSEGNVFVVGDVKQSIYRFRMAEPALFLDKYFGRVQTDSATFLPLHLSENYRSRREVVDAVNFIFSQLFSVEFGGAPYDDEARMQFAARYPKEEQPFDLSGPVEIHLIERQSGQTVSAAETQTDSDAKVTDTADEGENSDLPQNDGEPVSRDDVLAIEQEGRVIASRIREWMGHAGKPPRQVWDAKRKEYRPLQYRDIVILLRSVKGRMTPLLDIFRANDIPAYGVTSTGFYGALEIQWLLAALATVDNPRREIEFVATLRSPMGGFTDAELTDIRLLHKGNFYDAFRVATEAGRSGQLAEKVRNFLRHLNVWRRLSRRSSTEAVLMRILDDTGILDYIAAMTGGRVRVANVQILLERVREFDRTNVDGLFGFVTHARELLQHEVDLGEARTLAEAEDVVRVMTIHQSKGLEFPIVFVADLGKQFYRNPLERALPLHRRMGFGPLRTHPETDRRWRTMPSIAIEEAEMTEFLAEEARILYVALTRARERLVLVGSARQLPSILEKGKTVAESPDLVLPTRLLQKAKTVLDWLAPLLWRQNEARMALQSFLAEQGEQAARPDLQPNVRTPIIDESASFDVRLWGASAALSVETVDSQAISQGSERHSFAPHALIAAIERGHHDEAIAILSAAEQVALDGSRADRGSFDEPKVLDEVVTRDSPPAKISATELRRLWTARHRREQPVVFQTAGTAEHLLDDPSWIAKRHRSGRERGLAFHSVMQSLNLAVAQTPADVQAEVQRLLELGVITESFAEAVDVNDILGFLRSPLGEQLRLALATTGRVYREQPFFHRIDIGKKREGRDFVTVQGVMDCLAELPDKWLLIDYKTDNIGEDDATITAQEYTAQISVYMDVATAVVGTTKPLEAFVYFVQPGCFVQLQRVDVGSLFR